MPIQSFRCPDTESLFAGRHAEAVSHELKLAEQAAGARIAIEVLPRLHLAWAVAGLACVERRACVLFNFFLDRSWSVNDGGSPWSGPCDAAR